MANDLKSLVGAGSARELQEKLESWQQSYEVSPATPRGQRQPLLLGVPRAVWDTARPVSAVLTPVRLPQLRLFGFLSVTRFPEKKGWRLKVRFDRYRLCLEERALKNGRYKDYGWGRAQKEWVGAQEQSGKREEKGCWE